MSDFQKYIQRYLDLVPSENWLEELHHTEQEILAIYRKLNDETALFRYAENKWSYKELLQHLIDCERVYQFRAMSFARGELQNLTSFDEDAYAKNSNADRRKLADLIEEFSTIRQSSIFLYKSFSDEMLSIKGIANGNEISVESLGKLTVGHQLHHLYVIKEKYLK